MFKCNQCPATCTRKYDLRTHYQRLHGYRPTTCRRCDHVFSNHYQLKVLKQKQRILINLKTNKCLF